MYFNPDGTIKPVTMLVKDNFDDRDTVGWRTYGGSFSASEGRYTTAPSPGGKALLDTNFTDFVQDADLTLRSTRGDAGVVFRVTQPSTGPDSYRGYYAGVTAAGRVVLGKASDGWTQLATATISSGSQHHVRVEAVGSTIRVYVDDLATPRITVTDTSYASGANGVRVFNTGAAFDNFAITHK